MQCRTPDRVEEGGFGLTDEGEGTSGCYSELMGSLCLLLSPLDSVSLG